ncbi:electron transfer flavoprotein subunit alpha/FixB family protein [Chloroflexota bacterium]
MAENKSVMVYCEVNEAGLTSITTEELGCGRKLANDLGQELIAVLVGSGLGVLAQEAITFGADKAYVVDDPLLKDYQLDTHATAMEKVVKEVTPQILLLGQTTIGRDLAPRLAFRLGTTVTMDCTELAIDPESKRLLQTKPVYGGNAVAVFTGQTNPQITTIRAKAMTPLKPDPSRQGEVINIDAGLEPSSSKTRVLDKVAETVAGVKLEDALVIVAGGRGIGGAEGFQQLEELANLFKGAVGASRPACDNNWIPDSQQIGITGKIVAPELYFAVAISGSSQHTSGCSGSKNIIAINKDVEANIFKEARFGVVGDWKKVIPALTDKIKELLAT